VHLAAACEERGAHTHGCSVKNAHHGPGGAARAFAAQREVARAAGGVKQLRGGRQSGREGEAWETARAHGLALEPTYTAKALAAALARAATGRRVLYWHTLSSAPMESLLAAGPTEAELPPALARLFVG
jgi:hypothetical protein